MKISAEVKMICVGGKNPFLQVTVKLNNLIIKWLYSLISLWGAYCNKFNKNRACGYWDEDEKF